MSTSEYDFRADLNKLIAKLDNLELRVNNLETQLETASNLTTHQNKDKSTQEDDSSTHLQNESVESKVGEYGLAWLGAVVLFLSISFLMTYFYNKGHILLSSVLGYLVALCVFVLARFLRRPFPYLVQLLNLIGYILIYYTTLRLHYFSAQPLITSNIIVLSILAITIGSQIYFAIRQNSRLLAGFAILLLLATALISDATHIMLSIVTITAAIALYFFIFHGWWRLLFLTIVLVYCTHLLWLMNNPLLGHPLQAVATHQFNLVYLAGYGILFSFPLLTYKRERLPEAVYPAIYLLNGISFFIMSLLVILTFFQGNYAGISLSISIFCILFSIILRKKTDIHFASPFYACYGFMALSIALAAYSGFPAVYPLLALQSLLVVSIALWFQSRIIVVVNTFLFMFFLALYLSAYSSGNLTNFIFALTALATARIINWQKERLELRTELMRNLYLIAAFFMVIFSLYHAVPSKHITLAWTGAAIIYFVLSFFLKNVKYRWMAIYTLIAACIYLFAIDLAKMGIEYSIFAFLIIAIISISASLYYTKRKKSTNEID